MCISLSSMPDLINLSSFLEIICLMSPVVSEELLVNRLVCQVVKGIPYVVTSINDHNGGALVGLIDHNICTAHKVCEHFAFSVG